MRPGSALCASAGTASAIGRPSARSRGHPTNPGERVAPQRDPAASIDHAHALVDQVQHFPSPPILLQLVQVAAARLPAEGERHRDRRQNGPQLVGNQLGDGDGDRGADDVGRCGRGGSRRPGAIDRAPREHRHEQAGPDGRHETVRDHGRRDRNGLPRPGEMIGRPTEPEVSSAGSRDRSHAATRREARRRCAIRAAAGAASTRATAPATATPIAAAGPCRSNATNSTTNGGRIAPPNGPTGQGALNAAARIAVSRRLVISTLRPTSGQSATASSSPAPIAAAANR